MVKRVGDLSANGRVAGTVKMERLYCDASFWRGYGGMAVVGPSWAASGGGPWRRLWDVRIVSELQWDGYTVFWSACRCKSSNDAEKRAMGLAFLLAYDIVRARAGTKVEVLSDSLIVLNWITSDRVREDPILEPMRSLWQQRRVILSKVKGHTGNRGNELADEWAKYARVQLEVMSEPAGSNSSAWDLLGSVETMRASKTGYQD